MFSKIQSAVLLGIKGQCIEIETQIVNGLPNHIIVGLPSQVIRESKDRVKASVKSSGYRFPDQKITQNMFPAHIKKEGVHLDLPMALGIVACIDKFEIDTANVGAVGELSLSGNIRPINGIIGLVEALALNGVKKVIIPRGNLKDVAYIKDIQFYPFIHLMDVINALKDNNLVAEREEVLVIDNRVEYDEDYSEIWGQEQALRGIEIAIAGWHHILLAGPPGCGKTMIANRAYTILPDCTDREKIEIDHIKSIFASAEGYFPRPVCSPHHSISKSGMIGGTNAMLPGQITKAHLGVLHLDELSQFKSEVIESLREPMSLKHIQLVRNHFMVEFPSDFIVVATMNLCPCGYHLSKVGQCNCTEYEIKRYMSKISGAIWNRLGLVVLMDQVPSSKVKSSVSSSVLKQRINSVRSFKAMHIKPIGLEKEAIDLVMKYYEKGKLSLRSRKYLVDISRTIALLDGMEIVKPVHLHEAYSFQMNRQIILDPTNR